MSTMIPRRQPLSAGPDVPPMSGAMGMPLGAGQMAPMEFAPIEQTQGGQPDLSPLMMALTQRLAQNANTISGGKVSSKVGDTRRKQPFEQVMNNAGGGLA